MTAVAERTNAIVLPSTLSYSQASTMQRCVEEWRPVPFAEGYWVSNLGRVVSYRKQDGSLSVSPVRYVGGAKDRQGYSYFRVGRDGGARRVHRMVLWAFAGPPPSPAHVARHLDDDKDNNVLSNLAWGTAKDNAEDRTRNGNSRGGTLSGEDLPHTKLTRAAVREIRERRAGGAPLSTLAECYDVSDSTISLICLNKIWKEG